MIKLLTIKLLNRKPDVSKCICFLFIPLLLLTLPVIAGAENTPQDPYNISGVVTDPAGNPVPGATVKMKGTTKGTITDLEGAFTLTGLSGNDVIIEISFVGYKTKEIPVEDQRYFEITLQEDVYNLDELVIVGYGVQKGTKVTGAISNIRMESIESRPITNVSQALAGAASGIQITQNSSQPGQDGTEIRIRGVGTLTAAGQGPLVLVDGIASSMQGLNPADIENITVLKDAASAAIYGSRAANGVILITTKKGQMGAPKMNYSYYYGLQSPTRMMDLITDMPTHMTLLNEAKTNIMGAGAAQFSQEDIDDYKEGSDPLLYPNTDWFDHFYGTPRPIQNHNFSLNGGNDHLLYNLSMGYLNQEGMGGVSSLDKITLRSNTEIKISEKLKIGANISGFHEHVAGITNMAHVINDWGSSPGVVIQGPEGRYGGPQVTGEGNAGNPLAHISSIDKQNNFQEYMAKIYAEYTVIPGLTWKANVAMRHRNRTIESMNEPYELWDFRDSSIAMTSPTTTISLFNQHVQSMDLTAFTTLNFEKSFDQHYLNALAGYSIETGNTQNFSASINDLYSTDTPVLSAGISEPVVNGVRSAWGLISYFGRINYDYDEKYLFEANVRVDGSSKFKQGNRWATFPSFSAGWRVSKEEFFPDNTPISDLKVRGSWGMLGNQNIGNNYPYQAVYSLQEKYNFEDEVVDGAAVTALANDMITWETTTSANAAIDASLFNNRWSVTFDWFTRLTDDILVQLPIPQTMGAKAPPYQNIAQVRNWGYEIETSYRQSIQNGRFRISANFSQIENEVVKYKGDVPSINGVFIIKEGLPYNSLYGYKNTGIFQSWDEVNSAPVQHEILTSPGDLKYDNFDDSDEKIDAEDRQVIGNTIPRYYFGLSFDFQYHQFDIAALFQGIAKVDRYLQGQNVYPFATNDRGMAPEKWLNRWTEENPSNTIPRLTIRGDYSWNYAYSSFWVQDGSYVRLKNLQIGYTFPERWTQQIRIDHIRAYLNGQNLLTLTNYEGYDPEVTATQTGVGYPHAKIISMGIQVNF